MLTAFYMTRMMVMTFHGPNRTGEKEGHHLHEAPMTMTVPLIVLAVASVFGGWINVPEALQQSVFGGFGALPMTEWLHHWLEPVVGLAEEIRLEHLGPLRETAPVGGGEVLWAGLSTLAALAVVGLAFSVIGRQKIATAEEAAAVPMPAATRVLYNKWYVDELYDRVIVQPIIRASRFAWRIIDQGIIDGVVNGVGNLARALGWFGSLFQSGAVNTYALILTIGVIVILGYIAF
jgi:NADH-quinone oxidoreductase subunit L